MVALRNALDAAGFASTKIIIPDGGYDASIVQSAKENATFAAAFSGVGLHYPCQAHPEVQEAGLLFWASEDWWDQPTWGGAASWGHLLSQNYVIANMTTTIAWSPLWSVYSDLEDQAAGLLSASEPWSGHWEVSPPIWTSAQWLQFTRPGWFFLSVPSGSSGNLPGGGTYVSLVPREGPGLTLILETFGKLSARCAGADAAGPQSLVFKLAGGGGMPQPGDALFAWQTNSTDFFAQLPSVVVAADGTVAVTIGVQTMLTLTTVAGGKKGVPANAIPPSAPFPLPYEDDFSSYAEDAMARFFSDQFGSFAVRSGRLTQVAPTNPGNLAWSGDADPFTIIGGVAWGDSAVEATVVLPRASAASGAAAAASADGADARLAACDASAPEQRWARDTPAKGYLSNTSPGNGQQCLNAYGCGHKAVFWSCVTTGGSCCGADCYDGLIFALLPGGQVSSALADVGCLTATAAGGLTFDACGSGAAPPSNQTFDFDAATGLVELRGRDLCLSQPPALPPYAQVCTRIASYSAFSKPVPPPGYCLALETSGKWQLTSARGTLANGTTTAPAPGEAVLLRVSAAGSSVTASAGGAQLAQVSDSQHAAGMAGLGCSFGGECSFGSFRAEPPS